VLRYWLGVDDDGLSPQAAMPPHRAGPDALVTAFILRRMLKEHDVDQLVELSSLPAILAGPIGFGKHRGTRWEDLPRDYLRWIYEKSDLGADEKHTASHHLGARA
jgi:exodeoxyribonuclease X